MKKPPLRENGGFEYLQINRQKAIVMRILRNQPKDTVARPAVSIKYLTIRIKKKDKILIFHCPGPIFPVTYPSLSEQLELDFGGDHE